MYYFFTRKKIGSKDNMSASVADEKRKSKKKEHEYYLDTSFHKPGVYKDISFNGEKPSCYAFTKQISSNMIVKGVPQLTYTADVSYMNSLLKWIYDHRVNFKATGNSTQLDNAMKTISQAEIMMKYYTMFLNKFEPDLPKVDLTSILIYLFSYNQLNIY